MRPEISMKCTASNCARSAHSSAMSMAEFLRCNQRLRRKRPQQSLHEPAQVYLNKAGLLPPPTMVITLKQHRGQPTRELSKQNQRLRIAQSSLTQGCTSNSRGRASKESLRHNCNTQRNCVTAMCSNA